MALPLYKNNGLGTTIWSPLASGLLTGKHLNISEKNTRLDIEGMDWLKERVLGDNSKIEKTKKAHYVFLGIESSSKVVDEIKHRVRLSEDLLRHVAIKVDELDAKPSAILTNDNQAE